MEINWEGWGEEPLSEYVVLKASIFNKRKNPTSPSERSEFSVNLCNESISQCSGELEPSPSCSLYITALIN